MISILLFQNLLMLPLCTHSWRSWADTTITQIRYICDQTIFQKKLTTSDLQNFKIHKPSKTFYIIASFYLIITSLHHLQTGFQKLHCERTEFLTDKCGTSCIRNVFNLTKSSISPDYASNGRIPFFNIIKNNLFRD